MTGGGPGGSEKEEEEDEDGVGEGGVDLSPGTATGTASGGAWRLASTLLEEHGLQHRSGIISTASKSPQPFLKN